jgi:hypothetical protein
MPGVEGWEGEPGKDRRSGKDRRRERPKRTGFFIHKIGGTVVEVPCRALAMVNFEEKFKTSMGKAIGDLPASRVTWLAYECERLYAGYQGTYEHWLADLDTVEDWEEDLPLTERASASQSRD